LKVQSLGVDWTLLFFLQQSLRKPGEKKRPRKKEKKKKRKKKDCQSQEEIEKTNYCFLIYLFMVIKYSQAMQPIQST
jgi:hypothetical protein